MVEASLTGIHARPEDLISLTQALDHKREDVTEDKVRLAFYASIENIAESERNAGFTYLTGGSLLWPDLLRPFAKRTGSLDRWFTNNTFFRTPIVEGKIEYGGNVLTNYSPPESLLEKLRPRKLVLPAPYTLAKLSDNHFYKDEMELVLDYGYLLHKTLRNEANSVESVQFSDPALVCRSKKDPVTKEEIEKALLGIEIAREGLQARTSYHLPFGDVQQVLPRVLDFPVSRIGIDLYAIDSDRRFGELEDYDVLDMGIDLGCVDGRSGYFDEAGIYHGEAPKQIADIALDASDKLLGGNLDRLGITPNCGLELRPHAVAEKKVTAIGEALKILRGQNE